MRMCEKSHLLGPLQRRGFGPLVSPPIGERPTRQAACRHRRFICCVLGRHGSGARPQSRATWHTVSRPACLVPTNASVATTNAPFLTRCGCLVPACGAWTMWTPSFVTSSRGNGHGGTKATSCGAVLRGQSSPGATGSSAKRSTGRRGGGRGALAHKLAANMRAQLPLAVTRVWLKRGPSVEVHLGQLG
jgi:hypothetical protein